MRLTSKYMLKELVFPFLLALGIISFLLIANKLLTLVDLMLKYKVHPWVVLKLVAYILPATFAITVPMSLLVAVLMAFGRLGSDFELTALKAGGVGPWALFKPVLAAGLALSLGMLAFNEFVLPRANLGYKILFYDILRTRTNVVIQEGTYIREFEGLIFHVGKKHPSGRLEDLTVFLLPKGQTPLQVVTARRGRLVSDPATLRVYLEMDSGQVQATAADDPLAFTQMGFNRAVVDVDIQGGLRQVQGVDRKPQEMPVRELVRRIAAMPAQDVNRPGWQVEMHKKVSIPFACLAFSLVGSGLGALTRRNGRMLAFVYALALIFAYYVCLSLGETWGYRGSVAPWLGMWMPNLVLFAGGLWLARAAALERPVLPRWLRPHFYLPRS
jgi:LPS export ABC transporter permease LptF